MILTYALLTAFFGTLLLRYQDAFNSKLSHKAATALINIISVIMFIQICGTAKGTIVYLATIALFAVTITACSRKTVI
ncbi:hypothetical protein [Shewanella donghaensis]|uniref:hypothetical protein n=1 Tax=Shewanella donghaensis TaxID=238836 RepID=UPI001182C762|nr:hypothetical protein [Shewanella donghaensis]